MKTEQEIWDWLGYPMPTDYTAQERAEILQGLLAIIKSEQEANNASI